ncbi:MAG: sulfatase-like hydrolase/transferase [Gallionella sp.]|nr:sulfatase-like hydrolase/transferase [Gallionella sp.]
MSTKFNSQLQAYLLATLWLLPALLLVRIFESAEYILRNSLPEDTWVWLLSAVENDLVAAGYLMTLFSVPFFVSCWLIGIRAATLATELLIAMTILVGVLLSMYFVQSHVALGADLFGYSWHDINETLLTSSGIDAPGISKLLLLAIAIFATWSALKKFHPSLNSILIYLAGILLCSLLFAFVHESEANQILSANKLISFLESSFKYAKSSQAAKNTSKVATVIQEYPLMKPANQPDVLGPYFNVANTPPNIVVVAVEGLGRSFMPDGRYGGFTPFIESLANKSLYFPNFLATTGRSFGFLPSFFGSLPLGEGDFMSEGTQMPAHDTLISLLKKNGYRSNFFVGFEASFDGGDVFLERQGIDHILYKGNFGPAYQTMEANEGGFSWGYSDSDLFKRAQEYLAETDSFPRLDIYHTVNLHEPFKVPDTATWQTKVTDILSTHSFDSATKAEIERNPNIFRALLYSDDALRQMFSAYAKRADFERTIFIITGDHRLIPIPEESQIDRFSVPLIIWSPMLKHPERIEAVSSHDDMTPSLITFFRNNYKLDFPNQTHWLGTGLDMSTTFRNIHTLGLMRIKNNLDDYLANEYMLSGDTLYRVLPGLKLEKLSDKQTKSRLESDFFTFKAVNRYVMQNNKIKPDLAQPDPLLTAEQAIITKLNLQSASPGQAYEVARKILIDEKRYDEARLIARYVLRKSPNYNDIRMLMGRSYAWQGNHEEARRNYNEVIRRNPSYCDAYSALADLSLWTDHPADALAIIEKGLAQDPNDTDLLLHKARSLQRLKQSTAAQATLKHLLDIKPDMIEAITLKKSLMANH